MDISHISQTHNLYSIFDFEFFQGQVMAESVSEFLANHSADTSLKTPFFILAFITLMSSLSAQTVSNRPVSMAAPGNQTGPRVTLIKGRHQTCKITVFYHELTTDDVVLNTRMPRAIIIHDTASPPNQLY